MPNTTPRSYLFVPANRPERFDRACSSGADAVIVDLEDAVPPAEKEAARESLRHWLNPERAVLIRVNAADTPWHEADLALCTNPGVTGFVLPKAEMVSGAVAALASSGDRQLLPLIETAIGFTRAREIAGARGVHRLVFGSIDLQVDLGIDGDGEELLFFRSQLVLISRLAGIAPPVDGVCTEIDDPEQLQFDTLRGKRLGFGGKLCIHPRQVPLVNECFTPTEVELAWAARVLDAATKASGAAIAVDGRMVDRPVILKAERILALAGIPAP
ncbi:MAG: CoA ester lyase [Betaproteobacteria bacterium]